MDSYTKYIKGALVITPQDIKKKISTKGNSRISQYQQKIF